MERVGVMREARKARTLCGARDCYPFAMVVGMERLVGDPSVLRQIGLSEY